MVKYTVEAAMPNGLVSRYLISVYMYSFRLLIRAKGYGYGGGAGTLSTEGVN